MSCNNTRVLKINGPKWLICYTTVWYTHVVTFGSSACLQSGNLRQIIIIIIIQKDPRSTTINHARTGNLLNDNQKSFNFKRKHIIKKTMKELNWVGTLSFSKRYWEFECQLCAMCCSWQGRESDKWKKVTQEANGQFV